MAIEEHETAPAGLILSIGDGKESKLRQEYFFDLPSSTE